MTCSPTEEIIMDVYSLIITVAYLTTAAQCTWYLQSVPVCSRLYSPANGYVSTGGLTHGAVAKYMCQYGYFVAPFSSSIRVCENGIWTGTPPICEPMRVQDPSLVKCPILLAPRNGYIAVTKKTPGGIAGYKCIPGFTLRPAFSKIRQCQLNGLWNGVNPVCLEDLVQCSDPDIPLNGACKLKTTNKGSIAECHCRKDFELMGNSVRICQKDGKWSGNQPICKPRSTCESLMNPQNGFVTPISVSTGAAAIYSCDQSYGLHGNPLRICQANDQWSEREPLCIKRDSNCGLLPDPQNGTVKLSGTSEGSTAVYSCNPGFILEGNAQRQCQKNAIWSGKNPFCQRQNISCRDLFNPRNGFVSFTDSVLEGSLAMYSCKSGYTIRGSSSRVCQSNGNWSESAPVCQKIVVDCGTLDNPINGIVGYRRTGLNAVALYRCHRRFRLIGQNKRVCQKNSVWSGKRPVCRVVKSLRKGFCPRLSPPENGIVKTNTMRIGAAAIYRCSKDYRIVGDKVRRCLNRGMWSGVEPHCTLKGVITDFKDMKR